MAILQDFTVPVGYRSSVKLPGQSVLLAKPHWFNGGDGILMFLPRHLRLSCPKFGVEVVPWNTHTLATRVNTKRLVHRRP